jgi:catechol 2,3-dioxygenase-like lactoylglutathione lyase family enzyme
MHGAEDGRIAMQVVAERDRGAECRPIASTGNCTMAVIGLNHVNIRTTDVTASVKFYVDALGLEYRRGPLVMGNQGHWLYDESGHAIIHFRILAADSKSTGPLDHVALSCRDKSAIVERLQACQVDYSIADNLTPGVTQIFLKDPHGVALELNITNE